MEYFQAQWSIFRHDAVLPGSVEWPQGAALLQYQLLTFSWQLLIRNTDNKLTLSGAQFVKLLFTSGLMSHKQNVKLQEAKTQQQH